MKASRKITSRGFSLIEVLIALVILSVGLLGLAGLQTSSLHANDSAYLRTQANVLAYNLFDRMRANVSQARNKSYDRAMTDAAPTAAVACVGASADCTAAQLTTWDLSQWVNQVESSLPEGQASVTTDTSGLNTQVKIKLEWLQRGLKQGDPNSMTSLTITTAF